MKTNPKPNTLDLAHYTNIFTIGHIATDGIAKGEVPVTPLHTINFPWFTSDFSQDAQKDWGSGNAAKLDLRLEVKIPENDEKLVRWRDYAKRLNLREDWYERLTGPNVARNGRSWFVYRGTVPFDWISGAYFHPCRQRLTPRELREGAEVIGALGIQGRPILPGRQLTEEQAIQLSHEEVMTAFSKPVQDSFIDVAASDSGRPMHLKPASNFLDYVKGAAQSYREAFPEKFVNRNQG